MTIKVTQPWPPADSTAGAPAPHVEHLLAPNPSSWTYEGTNSYVIGHGGSSLIVDPGVPDDDHLQTLMRMSLAGEYELDRPLGIVDHLQKPLEVSK